MKLPVLSSAEAKRLELLRNALRSIPAGASPDHVFALLQRQFNFEGAFHEIIADSAPYQPCDVLWSLRDGFWDWMCSVNEIDPAPYELTTMREGCVYSFEHWVTSFSNAVGSDSVADELDYYESTFGYRWSCNLVVSRKRLPLDSETQYLCFLKDHNAPNWNETDHGLLTILQPDIKASLERVSVTLTQNRPILDQILREQQIGYVLAAQDGTLLEANAKAYQLLRNYISKERPRHVFQPVCKDLIESYGRSADAQRMVPSPDGMYVLDIGLHFLDARVHDLPDHRFLITLKEIALPKQECNQLLLNQLTPRQREIACALCDLSKSAKEVADQLNMSARTLNKHTENIYRRLRVHSRGELISALTK